MKLSVGFDIVYDCPKPTPMILTLSIHYSRVSDLLRPNALVINPPAPIKAYRDGFGNWCSRIVAPKGEIHLRAERSSATRGRPTESNRGAAARGPGPARRDFGVPAGESLLRDRQPFGDGLGTVDKTPTGWGRVQAICDFVHQHIQFGYEHAR